MRDTFPGHLVFWLFAAAVLTLIYGTAFGSMDLGWRVIAMLLPVHMVYFYLVAYGILPNLLFRKRYLLTVIALVLCALTMAVLYRLNEIFLSDPFIFRYYQRTDPGFRWSKLDGSVIQQLLRPVDFVNAIERSNVMVWIGVALQFVRLWYERRQAALQAELNFLKGQIHPHFLFNTLNNLYGLSLQGSGEAPGIILGLSHILRYMLYECKADEVALSRDVEILENYIALEKIRYEDRLDLQVYIKGIGSEHRIAPLLLLPLVENAFKHGASEKVEGAWINIELVVSSDLLKFKVANAKPEEVAPGILVEKIGLTNVRKRLDFIYPQGYRLEIWNEPEVFIVELELNLMTRT